MTGSHWWVLLRAKGTNFSAARIDTMQLGLGLSPVRLINTGTVYASSRTTLLALEVQLNRHQSAILLMG